MNAPVYVAKCNVQDKKADNGPARNPERFHAVFVHQLDEGDVEDFVVQVVEVEDAQGHVHAQRQGDQQQGRDKHLPDKVMPT